MSAKATKSAKSSVSPPKGMNVIAGGYAASWDVEALPTLEGRVNDKPRTVVLTKGKKETPRQCIEVRTMEGERFTVWESAGLVQLFEALTEKAPCNVWIHFRGYGTAKKGQNPPKLFDAAIG